MNLQGTSGWEAWRVDDCESLLLTTRHDLSRSGLVRNIHDMYCTVLRTLLRKSMAVG